jgi:hypothetical protein
MPLGAFRCSNPPEQMVATMDTWRFFVHMDYLCIAHDPLEDGKVETRRRQ